MKINTLTAAILLTALAQPSTVIADEISFTRDIRPILSNKCYKCHGPDEDARVTEMRLDTRHGLFGEKTAPHSPVVPRSLKRSEIISRILSEDPDIRMPPAANNKDLTADEITVLKAWVKQGAQWEPHWAFQAPQATKAPSGKHDWGNNPIDEYVIYRLKQANLSPSETADPHTLIRRLYLDLIGLPPTMKELDSAMTTVFHDDGQLNQDEYGNLVDRLLNDSRYGERWARRWLDLARYADTNGYEKDRDRNMWPFRDWVIRAINTGMPFDQFTIEQLAGDMLPNATPEQRIATGFHRNTMLNEEGGIDPLEFRFHAMTDRVATTGTTWLGLTTGCAQCHTHKYDPITHRQYYEFMAFMNNTDEPEMDIPDAAVDQRHQANLAKAEDLISELRTQYTKSGKDLEAEFTVWLTSQRNRKRNWQPISPASLQTNLPHLQLERNQVVFASGDSTKHDIFELEYPVKTEAVTAIRLEALPDPRLPNYGPGMTNYEGTIGDFFLTEFEIQVNGKRINLEKAVHSYAKNRYGNQDTSAQLMIDGDIQTGWSVHEGQGERHIAILQPTEPIPAGDWTLIMHFGRHFSSSLGKFRLSIATDNKPLSAEELPPAVENLLDIPDSEQTEEQRQALATHFLLQSPEFKEQAGRINTLRKRPGYQRAMVMQERPQENPRPTHRHHRGEYLSPKESVTPQPLNFLHPFQTGTPANRLGFAQWIVAAENPLTSRVVVNRHWDAFFGNGIVTTLDDFGFQGNAPSHPHLLDHLAIELLKNDWSIKWLHKYIVTSATYQQSSVVNSNAINIDPSNELLSYFPRTRLDAEVIRDSILQSAKLLSPKMYGPPVKPLQPAGIGAAAYGSPKWTASIGEERYRRSLYTYTKRTVPFAMFNTFDGPSGESCTSKRNRSNTALQALTLLNDVMFLDIARQFGQELAESNQDTESNIRMAFLRLYSRPPNTDELREVTDVFHSTFEYYSENPDSAKEFSGLEGERGVLTTAWAVIVRALFSTDEAITKN
ncbi:MAG: PSD1 and planctomycete cytochrome C domain-containing protein [Pirellulaceae bacterium]